MPFRSTRLIPMTSPTIDPSTVCHSIVGCGLPVAEQSRKPPDELLNSNLAGGSITKLGPRMWASKGSILGDITSGDEEGGGLFPGIFLGRTVGRATKI